MQYYDEYTNEREKISRHWEEFFNTIIERKKAHDNYIQRGIVPSADLISPDIVGSWQRSLDAGLDPDYITPVYLPESIMREKLVPVSYTHLGFMQFPKPHLYLSTFGRRIRIY